MTVNIDHPWSDRPLTQSEIADAEQVNRDHYEDPKYQDLGFIGKGMFRFMDFIYIRALKRGQSMEEARTAGPNLLFAFGGVVAGWGLCVVMLSFGTLLWGYAATERWINFSLTFIWLIILVLVCTGFAQKRIARVIRKAKERRKREDD